MKKLISVLLAVCLVFTASPLAFALNTEPTVSCEDPTIYIAGDSGKIAVKRVNTLNSLSTRISALIFRASMLAIESPSPNPGIDRFVGLL